MSDLTRGRSLEEAWQHFCRARFDTDSATALARFMGRRPKEASISRWMRGKNLPTGANLIQLMYFLDWVGYRLREVGQMDETPRELGRMAAFGVYTFEEVRTRLGYSKAQSLYSALRGHQKMGRERSMVAEEMIRDGKEDLATRQAAMQAPQLQPKRTAWAASSHSLGNNGRESVVSTTPPAAPTGESSEDRITALVRIIEMLEAENRRLRGELLGPSAPAADRLIAEYRPFLNGASIGTPTGAASR